MLLSWSENAGRERISHVAFLAKADIEAAESMDAKLEAAAQGLLVFPEMAPKGRIEGTRDLFGPPRYRLIYPARVRVPRCPHNPRLCV